MNQVKYPLPTGSVDQSDDLNEAVSAEDEAAIFSPVDYKCEIEWAISPPLEDELD
jgi:hypothetical protein